MKCKYCQVDIPNDSKFCPKCGADLAQNKHCPNCGSVLTADALCPVCDQPNPFYQESAQPTAIQEIDPLALKFIAKTGGASAPTATGNQKQAPTSATTGKAPKPPKMKESLPTATKPQKLWVDLANKITRVTYYSDDILDISEEQFGIALQHKLDANHVPSRVEKTQIKWDNSGVTQQRLIIHPTMLKDSPMCFSVGLNRIGNFTFIEERTYIKPPELPTTPGMTRSVPIVEVKSLLLGAAIFCCGFPLFPLSIVLGLIALVVGAILVANFFASRGEARDAKEYNKEVEKDTIAWEKAWDEWESKYFSVSYLANTDDVMGRLHQAFHDSIEQVSKELFVNQIGSESKETLSQGELRQVVEKRRASYK